MNNRRPPPAFFLTYKYIITSFSDKKCLNACKVFTMHLNTLHIMRQLPPVAWIKNGQVIFGLNILISIKKAPPKRC